MEPLMRYPHNKMATVTHIMNPNPRLTKYLVAAGIFAENPLTVIDIGAKGGFENHWSFYGEQARLIGFEPNIAEYEKLLKESAPNRRYFPTALSDVKGTRKFHVYSYASASSFLKPNFNFLKRLPDWINFAIKKNISVRTDTVDSVMRSGGIGAVDFIKLDTQGTELEILKGARKTLNSALGLTTEFAFNPFYEKETTFTDIDRFLRPLGFSLFNLPTFRYARNELSPYQGEKLPHHTETGQICWGEALYLRDAVDDIRKGKGKLWNYLRILKLASVMEIFSLEDCAMELISVAAKKGYFKNSDKLKMIRLLVPKINGKEYTYKNYIKRIKKEQKAKLKAKK